MGWSTTALIKGPTGDTGIGCDARSVGANWTPAGLKSGCYYFCNCSGIFATTAMTNTTIRTSPWIVTASVTITRLFGEYTAAGNSGSVFRIGLWADNGNGQPGTLVLDAGAFATDATPGVRELTVSQALTPGLYWVGGAIQGAATTVPTMRTMTVHAGSHQFLMPIGTSLPAAGATFFAMDGGTAAGAFANITTPTAQNAAARIGFKVA